MSNHYTLQLQENIKNAKTEMEKSFYQNRLDVYLRELETVKRTPVVSTKSAQRAPRKFINSFGEATSREITSASYRRHQARLSKQLLSFIG